MRLKLAGFVAAVSLAAAQSGYAADMPAKAPVYKAPAAAGIPWTGFYVNGGIGYGMWAADTTVVDTTTGVCIRCVTMVQGGKGWLATIGAGFDYQFAPKIVAGVFGEASLSSLKGTIEDQFFGLGVQGDIKQTSSWAAGGRVGLLVTPQTLSYVNGGYTAARFSGTDLVSETSGAPVGLSTPAFTASGWFVGGGVETSLAPNWFWRTEYRYAYYGNKVIAESPVTFNINFKPTVQTVTSQIVYKFNGGMAAPVYPAAPVVATSWTGFYANAGIGYGLWNADSNEDFAGTGVCFICQTQVLGGKGYLGVVGAGYDWQFAPSWVAGVFGDFDISSLKGTIKDQLSDTSGSIKQTSAWAVGPRLGWLPSPQTMTYVNGGYTGARFSGTDMVSMFSGAPSAFTTPAFTASGWFVGGGVETTFDFFGMLGKGWFWRNEYRYASYSNKTVTDSLAGVPVLDIAFKPTVQTVTSQLIFKFN
jgi:outer membrane immunogenic protein